MRPCPAGVQVRQPVAQPEHSRPARQPAQSSQRLQRSGIGDREPRRAAGRGHPWHRLVQAVTLDQVPPDTVRRWRAAAAVLTGAAIPADTSLLGTWPVCAVLLPHAQAVLDLTSDAMWRIALYLG
jgi:hypothetical protein